MEEKIDLHCVEDVDKEFKKDTATIEEKDYNNCTWNEKCPEMPCSCGFYSEKGCLKSKKEQKIDLQGETKICKKGDRVKKFVVIYHITVEALDEEDAIQVASEQISDGLGVAETEEVSY